MVELDLKDRKLLYHLDLDSRQPMRELARKAGLSKDSAIYRINRLREAGVIKGFQTLVDIGKLGYISFRLFLKLQNVTPEKEQEIISFLENDRKVLWLVSVEDGWDINTWIACRTIQEMNGLWKDLLERYGNYIERRWLGIFTKVAYFSRNYLLDNPRKSFVFITEPEKAEIDSKSEDILKILVSDSRASTVDIAGKLGISVKTAVKKIREMEKRRIISCYRLLLDLDKIGYKYYKMHIRMHNATPEKVVQLRGFVSGHRNVIYTDEVLGGEDFEIELHVKDIEELRGFITALKENFAGMIRNYEIMLYTKEHKYVGLPVE